MDALSATLAVATLASFLLSLTAAWKQAKGAAAVALAATLVVSIFFGTSLWANSKLKAENRILTDPQKRATHLIEEWKTQAESKFEFYSAGEAEGVVSAAADLMEDLKECRPGAFAEAQQRMQSARERTQQVDTDDRTDEFDRKMKILDIWQDAASAAYKQIEGVSITPPDCGRI